MLSVSYWTRADKLVSLGCTGPLLLALGVALTFEAVSSAGALEATTLLRLSSQLTPALLSPAQEMLAIMKSIYDMMGHHTYPVLREDAPLQHVEKFFQVCQPRP